MSAFAGEHSSKLASQESSCHRRARVSSDVCQRTHDAIHVARPTEGKASRISVHKDDHEEESLQSDDETAERR